ncbi:MAG TPA: serine/threonine-protein kinase [Thermoanaerobaculia bacterium]|nr:serine/threonine-protein kinase [Thermoanaerobaculia bacterium]
MLSTAASASSAWFPEASLDVEQESSLGRIGPYQVLKRIGAGGMGEVFLAYDSRLDRRVAIKRIRPGPEVTAVSRERFRREARLAARLSHSAIVQVYDILEEDESEYIVMEYVEGTTLREQVRKGPMDVRTALELARELAAGLDTAHRQGIIHRDLKTENVLISTSGGAKILDFGIAKRLLDNEEGSLTAESSILGTFRAMSPEQARGAPVAPSTDLFALGVLLYEALTGTSPFEAESHLSTLSRVILHRQEPAHKLNPAIPWQLSKLIDRLLEKTASLRPGSAAEVRRELEEIAARLATASSGAPAGGTMPTEIEFPTLVDLPGPPGPRPAPPRRFHLGFQLVLGIALLLLVALALASFFLRRGARDLAVLTQPVDRLLPARAGATFAVLRFKDLSARGEGSWMGTAFPEMITDLLAIDGRMSRAARQDVPLAELDLRLSGLAGLADYQRRLDVDYLIAGSYAMREDEKLIVRVFVVDRSGRRSLSEVLPGSVPGLVQLSSEIAGVVREELRLPLPGADGRKAVDAIYADLPPQAWPGYFAGLGHVYGANHEKAAQLLAETVPLAPRSPLPGKALALELNATGHPADAARAACRAQELGGLLPAEDRAEIAALCHELSGRTAEARSLYEALLRENPGEQARFRLKIAALDLHDRETDRMNDAFNVLQDLRSADPKTLRASDRLAADLMEAEVLFQKDRYSEARSRAHEAAERAGSLHAFADRAAAHRLEGVSLLHSRDYRGAIAPLQEACTQLAATRQELTAANCKANLAMAQFFGDRTPRYDLLAEARETYRAAGDLVGVGGVILLEAVLRQARGEHAEAEQLSREAEALFTRIGAQRELATGRAIMGYQLMFLGELQEARKVLDQAYAELSRQGQAAYAAQVLRNLGRIRFWQGDLRGARQAYEASSSGDSERHLALIEGMEGKLARAIELLKPLLVQEEPRNPTFAAEIAMDLSDLRQAEGAAGEALALAHRAEKILAGSERRDLFILAQLQLVKIHLAQKDFAAANERFEAIRARAEQSVDYVVSLATGITAARLKGLLGGGRQRDEALDDLARIERDCLQRGNVIYAFEARLAAGELMRPPERGAKLEEIAREARRLGLEQIARRAEKIRGEE